MMAAEPMGHDDIDALIMRLQLQAAENPPAGDTPSNTDPAKTPHQTPHQTKPRETGQA